VADALVTEGRDLEQGRVAFNARLLQLWEHIIHFLKLHYCLSERSEPFWLDNRHSQSMPETLAEDLALWRAPGGDQRPQHGGETVFPLASYLYVLYGMGFRPAQVEALAAEVQAHGQRCGEKVSRTVAQLQAILPHNRALLQAMNARQG